MSLESIWPILVCPDQIGGSPERPQLLGNRCRSCGEPFFPAAQGCTRCSSADLEPCVLGSAGKIWAWTIQVFEPKAPYDAASPSIRFAPYGVGYVELPNGLKIETRLRADGEPHFSIGQPVRLVLEPYRKDEVGQDIFTYAFEGAA